MQVLDKNKDVIKALQMGKDWAFELLFEKYNSRIYGLALKMGLSHEDAQGVLQEVLIAIWDQRSTLRADLSLSAFILTITKNKVIRVIRRNGASQKYVNNVRYLVPQQQDTTEHQIIYEDILRLAEEEIKNLPTKQRKIFFLSKSEGLTNEQIANRLKISKRTVENQLYRASQHLKKVLHVG